MTARYDTTGIPTRVRKVGAGHMGDRMAQLLWALSEHPWKNRHQLVKRYPSGYRGECGAGVGYESIKRLVGYGWAAVDNDGTVSITPAGREALAAYNE